MKDQQIYELLKISVSEVLETMSFLDTMASEPVNGQTTIPNLDISANVCIAGEISGLLAVHSSKEFAKECYELISGSECSGGDAELCDTVGELANMIAGTLKREMSSTVDLFFISLPSITLSDNQRLFYTGSKVDFPRMLVPFEVDGKKTFYVELLFHERQKDTSED